MNLGKEIYEELSLNTFKELQNNLNNKILIVKFGATWCKPCKTIKNTS